MPTFIVTVKEVHNQPYAVEAETANEARQIVEDGGGDIIEGGFEYNYTLDSDEWNIEISRGADVRRLLVELPID